MNPLGPQYFNRAYARFGAGSSEPDYEPYSPLRSPINTNFPIGQFRDTSQYSKMLSQMASRRQQINVYHQNLESPIGQHFKRSWGMPYREHSTTDPIKAALVGRLEATQEVAQDPFANPTMLSMLAVGTGLTSYHGYKAWKAGEDVLGGMGKGLLAGRLWAPVVGGGIALGTGKNWHDRLEGVGMAVADPIADATARFIASKIAESKPEFMGKIYNKVASLAEKSENATMKLIARTSKEVATGIMAEKTSQQFITAMSKLRGHATGVLGFLLAIPTWYATTKILGALGSTVDGQARQVTKHMENQQTTESAGSQTTPAKIGQMTSSFKFNLTDGGFDDEKVDSMLFNMLEHGYAF